jgi:hypothetical protein
VRSSDCVLVPARVDDRQIQHGVLLFGALDLEQRTEDLHRLDPPLCREREPAVE